jgi:hypothetical protein
MEITKTKKQDQNIFKDYTEKINNKSKDGVVFNVAEVNSINNLITFLNWSFNKKNNFFIQDFNKKKVFDICSLYNELKSEILQPKEINSIFDLFYLIDETKIKTLKFIIKQYVINFENIKMVETNIDLFEQVTKESMITLLQIINNKIK